jgi:hypothetical protein
MFSRDHLSVCLAISIFYISVLVHCLALSHRSLFVVLSDHCSLGIVCKHLFINTCSLLQVAFVVLQVSDPYRRSVFIFVLMIPIFVSVVNCPDFQIFLSVMNDPLAFCIFVLTSSSESPSLLMTIPR